MAAEAYAAFGLDLASDGLTVSAPVAPITRTASLQHPLFEAGFEGAPLLDMLISEPRATRVLCALLAFHDLLRPDAPSQATSALPPQERVAAILAEQMHGGVYAQPIPLERAIAAAAVAGFARKPRLLPPAVRFLLRGR